ncbi:hypothetical protein A4H97_12065 [Niastella yeongjuensis]|uniref:Uncharacterized protein n=1 Tax=Niastella yeongjuensis TaxID=354355 RepID=A0A1V9E9W8_9BACT|nr:hypothetical protein [Niastella yeongjuensis]OQP42881.1 hypothetical protein A4H97_12065 [Niastella yeongjuensis]SEO57995.1 hypothetical protein SAMN05660816_03079 [Niastella yeongjuensis]
MRLKKLRSFIGKLSVLGVYLLFLMVQLNLKYTFSYASGAHVTSITNVDPANIKGGKISIKVKKLSVHQPRYNKRYLHQDPYQVSSIPKQPAVEFIVATKPLYNQVAVLQNPELLHCFLRGPPTT